MWVRFLVVRKREQQTTSYLVQQMVFQEILQLLRGRQRFCRILVHRSVVLQQMPLSQRITWQNPVGP